MPLRQAAAEAGVSFSTFTRVEAGAQPDLTSFTLLCAWLGVSPGQFFAPVTERQVAPIDEAIAHLAADPRLAPDAASVLRPGVPHRLNSLLGEMHDKLAARVAGGEL